MLMRAATVVQQLCKSCRTCFKFYCVFYFTCDRSLRRRRLTLHQWGRRSIRIAVVPCGDISTDIGLLQHNLSRFIVKTCQNPLFLISGSHITAPRLHLLKQGRIWGGAPCASPLEMKKLYYCNLRNRLPVGGGCVYVLQLFFFCFFFRSPKLWYNRSRERLNGFSWNFHQTTGGKCSLKRRAAAWRKSCRRLANGECWWFASFTIWLFRNHQRAPRRLRYTTMSGRMGVI